MHIYYHNMNWHGNGSTPLRQVIVTIAGRAVRVSWGGYGYVCRPSGSWCVVPHTTTYRGTAYYLNWLAGSLSYLPNIGASIVGARRIF
jgi:hypothetical protein